MILGKSSRLVHHFRSLWVLVVSLSSIFVLQVLFCDSSFAVIKNSQRSDVIKSNDHFDIKEPADRKDWQFFMNSTQVWRKKLWSQHLRSGRHLADWSWTWRMAWLHVCTKDREGWCQEILQKSLFDRSVVVRAEAASAWGLRYQGSKNHFAAKALSKAFRLPANDRKGKPLFVKKKILLAMKMIGGSNALKLAGALANTQVQMWKFWNSL